MTAVPLTNRSFNGIGPLKDSLNGRLAEATDTFAVESKEEDPRYFQQKLQEHGIYQTGSGTNVDVFPDHLPVSAAPPPPSIGPLYWRID
jgi:hypothetical protein